MINSFTYPLAFLLTCQPASLKHCQLFGVNFNIESALAVHQLPIRWQIFNSRRGSFGLKLALACIMLANHFAVHKCVFIQNGGQLATKKVLFAANCTAFSGKTQGKMLQNARWNAAKCKVECIFLHLVCWLFGGCEW